MSEKHGSHWLEREDFGEVTVVRIKVPQLRDDDTTRDLFDQITTLVCEMGRIRIVLNMAGVEMIYSLGLGKLIMLNRRLQATSGHMVLCQLTSLVAEVIETAYLSDLFAIRDNEQQAIEKLATEADYHEGR